MKLKILSLFTFCLLACNDNTNVVNITIDQELLQSIAGTQTVNQTTATGSSQAAGGIPSGERIPLDQIGSDEEKAIFDAIDANAEALNSKNLQAFTRSLHPDSQIASAMPRLFEILAKNQTRYNILDKEIIDKTADGAVVKVGRRTQDSSGTIAHDVRYTLRTFNGDWKIFFMAQN